MYHDIDLCCPVDAADCGGLGDDLRSGWALELVDVLDRLGRATVDTPRGATGTAHRLNLHRRRRTLCACLDISPDTGA